VDLGPIEMVLSVISSTALYLPIYLPLDSVVYGTPGRQKKCKNMHSEVNVLELTDFA